ncbi:MAG TPA: L,D-transpeptidase family protein [Gammaproteobacteria bacterium]|nr:L,D-transpeptidase family protein [Gammaproteobacteria bacterium]
MVKKVKIFQLIALLLGLGSFNTAVGLTFDLPDDGDIVGEMQTTTVRRGESLGDIGRRFDVGVYEMIEANPRLDPWGPTVGAIVLVPTQFILPNVPRVGLVLNLAEMRLYYFHLDKRQVTTHPLGIGKKGWTTPLGTTSITNKRKDPPWHPPASIRQEHIENNDPLPPIVAGGTPENPLGRYALYLGRGLGSGAFLIHGTNRPSGIGVRGTHGCVRLLPEDIEDLFYKVPIGTAVRIIHEPFKVGWHEGHLYLEAHEPCSEPKFAGSDSLLRLEKMIQSAIEGSHMVNWASATMGAKQANGYPVRID